MQDDRNQQQPDYPLAGVRVVDLSRALSGPFVGRILSDLGADVVKVERPSSDITHAFGVSHYPHSGLYTQLNAGKRNLGVDLQSEQGRHLAHELARVSDVLIENFRPGTMERLGLGPSALLTVNPKLIVLSISGFGQQGPEANRRAYAPVIHAESGLLGRAVELDGGPASDIPLALADSTVALHGAIAILAALRHREATGHGQHIDVSMLDSMLATDDYIHYSLEDNFPFWPARGEIFHHPDGDVMVGADQKKLWTSLSGYANLPDAPPGVAREQKFAHRAAAVRDWALSFKDRDELLANLEAAGLAWANVRGPHNVLDSPTVTERGVSVEVDDRAGGTRPVVRMPYRYSAAACGPRRGPAFLGEHNQEILAEWLGVEDEAVARLQSEGALLADEPLVRESRR